MISLDQKILDPHSQVSERMRSLIDTDIIIPTVKNSELVLSENVKAYGTGGNKLNQFFRVIKLGRKLQAQNSYNLITTQDPFMTALSALLIRKKELVEIQVHGDFFSSKYFKNSSFKNYGYYWLARLITLPRADKIRTVGERVKQSLVKFCDAQKIKVRPVFFDAQKIQVHVPQKNLKKNFPGFRKYFLYVGRLEKEKNVAWLIKVFDQYLRDINSNDGLIIAGAGSQKIVLEKVVVKSQRTQSIKFTGWLTEPLDYLKTADCVLISSQAEGYGLVAMEAAALDTKLITTDVGVANYELPPSEKVMIIPVNDQAAFISALKKA